MYVINIYIFAVLTNQSSVISTLYPSSFILLSLHILKCTNYPKHNKKNHHSVNLNTKLLILMPTSFLKETCSGFFP